MLYGEYVYMYNLYVTVCIATRLYLPRVRSPRAAQGRGRGGGVPGGVRDPTDPVPPQLHQHRGIYDPETVLWGASYRENIRYLPDDSVDSQRVRSRYRARWWIGCVAA